MLIAVMSNTFAAVTAKEAESALRETIELMADYSWIVTPTAKESKE